MGTINDIYIQKVLEESSTTDPVNVRDILSKAKELRGLSTKETAVLLNIESDALLERLFETANYVKEQIYGKRLVLFAPLYVSNYCSNNCLYCGFRAENKAIDRIALSNEQIAEETRIILEQGHKRVLMLMGENHHNYTFDKFIGAIETVYKVRDSKGSSIRRINIEIAPLEDHEFEILKTVPIGTYTVFQETYHRETYTKMHPTGKKANYDRRLQTMDRALQSGLHDVGIGALYGLYDYKFETLAMLEHAKYLDTEYNIGPHTISIPRIKPAANAPVSNHIPSPVSDRNFKKIVAVLRCSVPYTGIILSTREPAELRSELYELGISQISAGSRTNPGGYKQAAAVEAGNQFNLNDCRSSGEVISDIISRAYIPSFCTGCYRLGRTGKDFMDLAKPGLIKLHCLPNALTTLKEYLTDYADERTKLTGSQLIDRYLTDIPSRAIRKKTEEYLKRIELGERDLYL